LEVARPLNGKSTQADGSVEAVVLLPRNDEENLRVVICTFLDKELVSTFDPATREFNDRDSASACDRLGSYLAYESFAVQVDAELPDVQPGSVLGEYLGQYSGAEGISRMLEVWGQFALIPDSDKDEIPGVVELVKKVGLPKLLQLNAFSMRRLARISLQPIDGEPPIQSLSTDDEEWINQLNCRSRESLGFSLIEVRDGRVESSRI